MNILDQIIADKKTEVALKKQVVSLKSLEQTDLFGSPTQSLKLALKQSAHGIIAEHKRRSPSKTVINQNYSVNTVIEAYTNAGVCGISVLTDGKYFGGSLDDLLLARASTHKPLLRKDFIIDAYQITEAKAYGADVILLIAAVLTSEEMLFLSGYAKDLSLEVLVEVHNLEELKKVPNTAVDLIGVNNRNLKTFEVNIQQSIDLLPYFPENILKISESGLKTVEDLKYLQQHGFEGFLMGEYFMASDDIHQHLTQFINHF